MCGEWTVYEIAYYLGEIGARLSFAPAASRACLPLDNSYLKPLKICATGLEDGLTVLLNRKILS